MVNSSISVRARLVVVTIVLLMLGLSGCAGYQTFEDKVGVAKQNFTSCQLSYRIDPQLRAYGDLLLTDDISAKMMRNAEQPSAAEKQVIKKLRSSETSCRRSFAVAIADAFNSDYSLKHSYAIDQTLSVGLVEYVKGTDDALKDLVSGGASFGDFYEARKSSTDKLTRTTNMGSLMAAVESSISYQQRRDAANKAMANVQKGQQENCIGCAFSKENRKKSGSSIVTQRSNGVLQGQVVAGANKICRYNRNGSTNYVTVKAHELCPLSSTDDAATEDSFNSNGVFKSSYNNGLNKVCVYDQFGSKNVITVGLTERCPG